MSKVTVTTTVELPDPAPAPSSAPSPSIRPRAVGDSCYWLNVAVQAAVSAGKLPAGTVLTGSDCDAAWALIIATMTGGSSPIVRLPESP